MYRRYKFVLLLICLIWMAPINAQLKLSVNAPSVVEANPSYFQIKYTLNLDYAISSEDISDFHFSTDDFTLLSEPGRSFRKEYININGRTKTNCSVTITCTLRPKAKGTFTISPASVHVKGKTYKSKAVKIRVADNAQGNGNRASSSQDDKTEEENAMRIARTGLSQKDLYITADLQKTTVYEQEAVHLKYHVLALPGVGLSNAGLNEKPDFKNIVSLDIPTNPEFTLAHVNGIAYKKYKAKEYVLYPQKAGQIQIPKLTFDCMVMQRDILLDRIDDFLNGGGIGVNVKRSAPQCQALTHPETVRFFWRRWPLQDQVADENSKFAHKRFGHLPHNHFRNGKPETDYCARLGFSGWIRQLPSANRRRNNHHRGRRIGKYLLRLHIGATGSGQIRDA